MFKILIAMPEFSYGGAERQVSYLINGISKKADVTVLVYHSYNLKETTNIIEPGIQLIETKFNEIGKVAKIISKFSFSHYIRNEFEDREFDIIVIYSPIALLCSKVFKKKCKKLIYLERNSGEKTLTKHYYKSNLKYIDRIITNSNSALNLFKEHGFDDSICINNGIMISNTAYSSSKITRALIPARIANIKNQKIVIQNLDSFDIHLILAGPIEDEKYYEELMAINSNLKNRFEYVGVIDDMSKFYKSVDLVVLPSFSEGTPNVILEAFANRILCISSNIEMNRSLFMDSNFLFDPYDNDSLKKCFDYIASLDKSKIETVIEQNYKYVRDNYSVDNMVESYYDAFTGILEK